MSVVIAPHCITAGKYVCHTCLSVINHKTEAALAWVQLEQISDQCTLLGHQHCSWAQYQPSQRCFNLGLICVGQFSPCLSVASRYWFGGLD